MDSLGLACVLAQPNSVPRYLGQLLNLLLWVVGVYVYIYVCMCVCTHTWCIYFVYLDTLCPELFLSKLPSLLGKERVLCRTVACGCTLP